MSSVIATIVPVFGLITLGFLAGRTGYLSEAAAKGLPEFVFRIAMPVMLFRTIGTAAAPAIAPSAILASFFGAAFVAWVLAAILARVPLRRPPPTAPRSAWVRRFPTAS